MIMMRMTGGVLVLATVFATGAADLSAQRGRGGDSMRGMQGRQGQQVGVETIMSLRDRLELTDEQFEQLDVIRRENVQRRNAGAAETTELQSRYAAGLIQRSDVMAGLEARREATKGQGERQREALESILNEEQRGSLNQLRRQGRASSSRGGQGMRGRMRRGGMQGRGGLRNSRGGMKGRSGLRNDRRRFRG